MIFFFFSIQLYHKAPVDCQDCFTYTPLFHASKAGALENIYELQKYGANVNHVAKRNGKTPLFRARTQDTANLLLQLGADPFKKAKKTGEEKFEMTAIECLMKYTSACPKAILDHCLIRQQDDTLILDLDVFDHKKKANEMSLYEDAIDNQREDLFLHPLMQIFLYMKFESIKHQLYFQFAFQIVAVIYFTFMGIRYVTLDNCKLFNYTDPTTQITNSSCFHMDFNNMIGCHTDDDHSFMINSSLIVPVICRKNALKVMDEEENELEAICHANNYESVFTCWGIYLIFPGLLALLIILRELDELCSTGYQAYIKSHENHVQLIVLTALIGFMSRSFFDLDNSQHWAAWLVFFTWIDLTLRFGEMDTLGEYIYMSVDVLKTMGLCIVIYIPSFFAFSFGFYILLNKTESFNSYVGSIIKVLAMSIGELDYTDNFDYHIVNEIGGRNISSQIMLVGFIIMMVLIMMNILLAVTVSKTEELEPKSKIMQAQSRIYDVLTATNERGLKVYKRLWTSVKEFFGIGNPILKADVRNKVNTL